MRTHVARPSIALLLLFLAGRARADEVVLTHGSRLTGVVLAQDEAGVRLLQPQGDEVVLAAADVKEVLRDADAPQGDQVLRYSAKGPSPGLQVALIHLLHPTTGRRVDLVSAVHIADAAYYRAVQRLLEADDVVLYEMVKPKDAAPTDRPPAEKEGATGLRDIQRRMGEFLGLTFQMDQIAYGRPHFVHADLTLEEFMEAPSGQGLKDQLTDGPLVKMIDRMLKPGAGKGYKALLAGMLAGLGTKLGALLGDDASELLLDRRNAVVVKRLEECAADAKTVAVFYGAAHLPDLEKRITALGYRRVGARWLTAWDTRPEKPPAPPAPVTPPAQPAGAPAGK